MSKNKSYNDHLNSEYWKEVSLFIKRRAGFKCQVCNSQHGLCAHHRTYEHLGRELDYPDDLICLCNRCHHLFHNKVKPPANAEQPLTASPMPTAEGIVITKDVLSSLKTDKGGMTNATIIALGVKFPLISGWAKQLIGTTITEKAYEEALAGREKYSNGKK